MPNSTIGIGSPSTRSEPTPLSISRCRASPKPATARSLSGGLRRTVWTSSRAWARRSSLAFYEVVMAKAFRTLVDDGTEVSVETGLRAAGKLQSVLDGRERGTDVLELKVQLGQISDAVKSTVPQEMWGAIVEKLEELEQ